MRIADVPTPALVVNLAALRYNVEKMAAYFSTRPQKLRPHFKAHKCLEIAELQLAAGSAVGLTCATVYEAEVLAEAGYGDILLANEVASQDKAARLASLAAKSKITVAVDSGRQIELLEAACRTEGSRLGVLVDINVGLPRCGAPPQKAVELARAVGASDCLELEGIMGYEGHCVLIADRKSREAAARASVEILLEAKNSIEKEVGECRVVSAGGTGTYDITGDVPGVTEIQAGSYVLMDDEYAKLDLGFVQGLFLLTTVISSGSPNLAVADGGLKALSTDHGLPRVAGAPSAKVLFLSDEHATISTVGCSTERPQEGQGHQEKSDGTEADHHPPEWISNPPVEPRFEEGSKLLLSVTHIDPTINMHDRLVVVEGEEVVDIWPVAARGWGARELGNRGT